MEKEPEIKKLTGYISLIYVWALLYACIGLFTYYAKFSVNIFQYLDLTELIHISLSKFAITTGLMLILLFLSIVFDKNKFSKQDSLDAGPNDNFKVFAYPLYTFIIIALISGYINYLIPNNLAIEQISHYSFLLSCFFLPIYLSLYYIYTWKNKKEVLTVLLILLVPYSCMISAFLARYESENIKQYALINTVYIGNKQINSINNYYYIGHTRNYVFYYNDILKVTDIFPSTMVSKMTLK